MIVENDEPDPNQGKKLAELNSDYARQRQQADQSLRTIEYRYSQLFEHMNEGIAYCRMIEEPGQAKDFVYLEVNTTFATLTGLKDVVGKRVSEIIPGFREMDSELIEIYSRVAATGQPEKVEVFVNSLQIWLKISVYSTERGVFAAVFANITERKQGEMRLVQLAAIVESSDDAIAGQDENGIITAWNRGAEKLFGYSADEMTGTAITRLIPAGRQDEEIHFLEKIKRGEAIGNFETQRQAKGGRMVDVSITVSPIKNAAGQIIGVSRVARDITERKRAENEMRQVSSIVEASPDLIGFASLDGQSLYVNSEGRKLIGLDQVEDVKSKSVMDYVHESDRERFQNQLMPALFRDGYWDGETLFKNLRTGAPIFMWQRIFFITEPETHKRLSIATTACDITERKAMEASLNEALITAEAGNRAKNEFLGIMSHELRTPLNGVLGCTELLTYTSLDDEQKSLADTVTRCGEHLLAIVKDILDYSSIEAGALKINVAPMPVAENVELSVQAVRPTAVIKGHAIRCEIYPGVPEQITGDALRIRQILINLLSNAVKFTCEGSVVLRIAPDTEGRFLEFAVEDTGIGMSSETIGILFKPFTQSDSTLTRAFGGTGLGLAISMRLAAAMGGSIKVASTLGKGSTFTLRLPLEFATVGSGARAAVTPPILDWKKIKGSPTPHRAPVQTSDTPMPLEGKLVLVVEDNPENALMAGKMLQSLGYCAEFAANGAEAVKACKLGNYSAVLMDVVMPIMDGLEATKRIRQLESGSRVPIIALTANVMPGDSEQYIAGGMDDYLSKPFSIRQLAGKLAAQANGTRHADESGQMATAHHSSAARTSA